MIDWRKLTSLTNVSTMLSLSSILAAIVKQTISNVLALLINIPEDEKSTFICQRLLDPLRQEPLATAGAALVE